MSAIVCPEETRLRNLEAAQQRRLQRYALLLAVEARTLPAAELVLDPPECLAGMFVFDFLRRVPRLGHVGIRRLNKLAVREGVNLAVSIRDLTPGRRVWLAAALNPSPLAARPQG